MLHFFSVLGNPLKSSPLLPLSDIPSQGMWTLPEPERASYPVEPLYSRGWGQKAAGSDYGFYSYTRQTERSWKQSLPFSLRLIWFSCLHSKCQPESWFLVPAQRRSRAETFSVLAHSDLFSSFPITYQIPAFTTWLKSQGEQTLKLRFEY